MRCKQLLYISPNCLFKNKNLSHKKDSLSYGTFNIEDELKKCNADIRISLIYLCSLLENHIENLISNYIFVLKPLFIQEKLTQTNRYVFVCIRYQFFKTFHICLRLKKAWIDYLKNKTFDQKASLEFIKTTLMPHNNMYHNKSKKSLIAARTLNTMYYITFIEHITSLMSSNKFTFDYTKYDSNNDYNNTLNVGKDNRIEELLNIDIIIGNEDLNDLLKWCAILSSYPIVPPNLCGELVSTSDKQKGTCKLTQPGYDNSSYLTSITSPIVCIKCKLLNLSCGQTDDKEQRKKLKCNCLFRKERIFVDKPDIYKQEESSFLNNLSTFNAQTCLHLLYVLNKNEDDWGCKCNEHESILFSQMKTFYNMITNLHIVSNLSL